MQQQRGVIYLVSSNMRISSGIYVRIYLKALWSLLTKKWENAILYSALLNAPFSLSASVAAEVFSVPSASTSESKGTLAEDVPGFTDPDDDGRSYSAMIFPSIAFTPSTPI
jgi:hypothetical protein